MSFSSLAIFLSSFAFLFSLFSFLFFKSYLKRRTSQERLLSEIQREANAIVNHINENTFRAISLMEEKEQVLRTLQKETEKRISVYIKEIDRAKKADAVYEQVTSTNMSYSDIGKNRHRLNFEVVSEQVQEPASEPSLESSATPKLTQENGPETAPEDKPSVREQIISLVKAGFSASAIASRLGVSISQVELAAILHEKSEE